MKKLLLGISALSFLIFTSCSKDEPDPVNVPTASHLVAKAEGEADLSLFVEAIRKVGLEGLLTSGTHTVFAPNNTAFQSALADLNANSIDDLINIKGVDEVKNIMLYHILPSEIVASNLVSNYYFTEATNDDGNNLSMYVLRDSGVEINGSGALSSTVLEADLQASNGVIHKVDALIFPATISILLQSNPEFNTLTSALGIATGGLLGTLSNESSNYTLFAPDNFAFSRYFMDNQISDLNQYASQIGPGQLQNVLLYHLLPGIFRKDDLQTGTLNTSYNGEHISIINDSSGNITINDNAPKSVTVVFFNITAINGVVHVINNVLEP